VDLEFSAPVEGNLEASHLLEQIESLRGTVRFLRTENGYLKGQELLKEIESLPPLGTSTNYDAPGTPTVSADSISEVDEDLAMGHKAGRRSLRKGAKPDAEEVTTEGGVGANRTERTSLVGLERDSKLLYRKLLEYSASPKLIDLGVLEGERKRGWIPQRKTAAYELWERKREGDRLRRQVQGLRLQTARLVSISG
jgi:dynactin 1